MKPAIAIRPMTPDDYGAVHALWLACAPGVGLSESDSRDGTRAFLERNPGMSAVALAGDLLVGAVLCGHDGRRGTAHLASADWHAVGREPDDGGVLRRSRPRISSANLPVRRNPRRPSGCRRLLAQDLRVLEVRAPAARALS